MSDVDTTRVPLAVLGVPEIPEVDPQLPVMYIPRTPDGRSFREVIERAVGWGRR